MHHTSDSIAWAGTPLLVVGADHDRLIRPANQEHLADRLQPIEFLFLSRGSHGVHEERASEVNAAIERLFAEAEQTRNKPGPTLEQAQETVIKLTSRL